MGDLTLYLRAVDAGYTQTLQAAGKEIQYLNMAAAGLQTTMNALRIYSMTSAVALGAMVLPGILASRMLAEYDLTIRRVMAAGGSEFAGHFNDITSKIGEMTAEFGIAKEDIATGILDLAKAGFSYSQIMDQLLIPITQLAIANGKDFAVAAEVGTVAWQLYGDEIGDASRMMQIMHTTAIESLADIDDFLTMFEYAGGLAVTTGVSFEEFMAQVGALSQMAMRSGQNLGTFFARMRASGAEIEQIFGLAPGTILSDGNVNLTKFNEILLATTSLTEDQKNRLSELWGIRADKVFYTMKEAADEYGRILGRINTDNTSLVDGFNEMSVSIQYVWGQIMGVLQEPLIGGETLTAMSEALQDLKDAIAEGELGEQIKDIIISSLNFLTESGPDLIRIAGNLLDTFIELTPVLIDISEGFMAVLKFVSDIPAPVLMLIGTIVLFNKIIPITTTLMWLLTHAAKQQALTHNGLIFTFQRLGMQITLTRIQFLALNAAMMGGVMMGFMLLVTGKDKVVRTLGAIMIAASALAMVMWQLAAANVAAQSGILAIGTLPIFAATAVATMAGIAAVLLSQREGMAVGGFMKKEGWKYLHEGEYVIPEEKFGDALLNIYPELKTQPSGAVSHTATTENYYDNRVVNVYDTDKSDLERSLNERGRI